MVTIPITPPKPIPKPEIPPTEDRLRMMLKNGPDLYDVVQGFIDKHKLPYTIEKLEDGSAVLKDTLSPGELHLKKFITEHEEMLVMKDDARKMSKVIHEVLIVGETGTGKEIIAKSMIADRKGAIKAVNCAGFPEQLIESELFGHKKGSFTGADTDKEGLIEAANEGVMFLDEVGELPMSVQAKLLRVLQEREIRRVGSNISKAITCKFVFATHRDLRQMVKDNLFRKDLYARISTLEIGITSILPDRKCDIIPITKSLTGGDKFLEKYQAELTSGLLDLSLNVRSLQQHVIRYNTLGRVTFINSPV